MNDSLVNTLPKLDSNVQPVNLPSHGYVDAAVQTNIPGSLWGTIKQWFLEVFSIRGSELSSIGNNKVDNWRTNLDSVQSVSLHNSESPLTPVASNTSLHQLV